MDRQEPALRETRAAELHARLVAIVDSSDDAIISKALDGIITSWNRGAERMFGWTAAEATDRHITLIIPEDRRSEEEYVLASIRRGEPVDHFETVRVTKDGRLIDISLTVSPVRGPTGQIIGASKIARDITTRRHLEAERDRLLLSERRARAEAEAASRAKDQLLATVSHELRTPLNAILGWARLLQTDHLDEHTRRHAAEVIVRNVSSQARLVEDLLDLSRVVTGQTRPIFEECELTKLAEEVLNDTVQPAATAKGIELITALTPNVGPIHGVPDRLRQVISNLAMNAIKFTPAGGRVEIAVMSSDRNAKVVVADTGVGISAAVLPYVFEPFRQEDSSSTRAHGGLGLGLALVKHFVELHGGQVHAESPGKGEGATFTVSIPLAAHPHSNSDPRS
jgi:PAS domain S-box-containing protein